MTATVQSDVVFGLSFETWNDMVIREFARPPDRLAQFLMTNPGVGRVMVVNPWRSAAGQLRRRVGKRRDTAFPATDRHTLLRPIRLRRGDSAALDRLARSYRNYDKLARVVANHRGLTSPLLITFNPFFAAHADHDEFASVTYVARDDWASYHGTPHLRAAYLDAYRRIRRRRIAVSAVSRELLDRLNPSGPARVVPNGVDPGIWLDARPEPPAMARLPRPIALYTGTVDERLSLPALTSLEAAFSDGTIVMIGPRDSAAVERIRVAAPSVHFVNPMKQSELAAYVRAADVCVLPHVASDLTRAMSPLKIYEYLAAGVRVVATDLPPVRDIDADIDLVAQPGEFGAAARSAAALRPIDEPTRRRFVADNAWSTRCAEIFDLARTQES